MLLHQNQPPAATECPLPRRLGPAAAAARNVHDLAAGKRGRCRLVAGAARVGLAARRQMG